MRQIFVFAASDPRARKNLDESIRKPQPFSKMEEALGVEATNAFRATNPELDGVYAWGATPTEKNPKTWGRMRVGDLVFAAFDRTLHFAAVVLAKVHSQKFAEDIWRSDAKTGMTWEYMYLLSKPVPIDLQLSDPRVAGLIGSEYRGFTTMKTRDLFEKYGSAEGFASQVLGWDVSAEGRFEESSDDGRAMDPAQRDEQEPRALERLQAFSRAEVRDFFEPPGSLDRHAVWRQSGIVQTPPASGDFVFFVTLGGDYEDKLYEDGFLLWKSQTQQTFKWADVQRFIAHDSTRNNIHLFIRTPGKARPYFYLGLLDYVRHDPLKEGPCEFLWRILGWEVAGDDLSRIGLPFEPPLAALATSPKLPSRSVVLKPSKPPSRITPAETTRKAMVTTAKRGGEPVDWAALDEQNRALGMRGEELVMDYEISRLRKAGKPDLAMLVDRVSLRDSRAGFDIRSFEIDGRDKLIEVKTTSGGRSSAFFISANEVRASALNPDAYCIYRVFGLRPEVEQACFYVLKGDVALVCNLSASTYLASPRTIGDDD